MKKTSKIIYVLLGILSGFCLAIILGMGLFFMRIRNIANSGFSITATMSMLPLSSQTPDFTSNQDRIDEILDKAEELLNDLNYESALKLADPLKQKDLTVNQTIRLYAILAQIEYSNGNNGIACSYYEQIYALDKTPENLYLAATVCYAAAETSKALDYFTALRDWQGFEDYEYRVEADEYIKAINESLGFGTPTLTLTPTPLPTRTPRPELYPENKENYQVVTFRDGSGKITLTPGGYALLHFVSFTPIKVISTRTLSLEIHHLQAENLEMKIGIFSRSGQWLWITEPHNGNENIMNDEDFINSDGSLYVMLVNNSSTSSISIDNVSFIITAILEDNSMYHYGDGLNTN